MNKTNNETHEKIRQAFLDLIREKGYRKTTFKEVASASGMTRQNLYYYYDSKEGMLQDVIEEFFDRLIVQMMVFVSKSEATNTDNARENITISEALLTEIAQALLDDVEVARCFFSDDVEKIFITKEIAFLRRILGNLIRGQDIKVNDPQYIHYLSLQMAGAIYFPIKEWLLNGQDFSVHKIVALAYPMFEQSIQSLMKN